MSLMKLISACLQHIKIFIRELLLEPAIEPKKIVVSEQYRNCFYILSLCINLPFIMDVFALSRVQVFAILSCFAVELYVIIQLLNTFPWCGRETSIIITPCVIAARCVINIRQSPCSQIYILWDMLFVVLCP